MRPTLLLLLSLAACTSKSPIDDTDTDTDVALPDADGDGTPDADDCAPDDPTAHPGADETCDGQDDDCDGDVDEGAVDASTFFADADGDSYGDLGNAVAACTPPAGTVTDSTDCDDAHAEAHPGATEVCDGLDDDCDGDVDGDAVDRTTWYLDADGDGYTPADAAPVVACEAPAGYVNAATPGDCDDASAAAYPGALEICDDRQDDCDAAWTSDDGLVTWFPTSGDPVDQTAAFADGYVLPSDGTLLLCDGTWSVQLDVAAPTTVTVRGLHGATGTILDGGGRGTTLTIDDPGAVVTLDGLTLANGGSVETDGLKGGAVALLDGELHVANAAFTDDLATNDGQGGAIYVAGGKLAVSDTSFTGCEAAFGGALYASGGSIAMTDATIADADASQEGGALFVLDEAGVSDVTLTRLDVSDAHATFQGGMAYFETYATVLVDQSTITGGHSSSAGAIFSNFADLTVRDTTIDGVSQTDDGAIWAAGGTVALVDTLITGSTSDGAPAGLRVSDAVTTCEGSSTTVAGFHANASSRSTGAAVVLDWGGAGSFTATSCDFGDGADDNTPYDVLAADPDPESYGQSLPLTYGDDATFRCDPTLGCS